MTHLLLIIRKKKKRNHANCFLFTENHVSLRIDLIDNLGQKVRDKLTKLSKIGFSMECFTADFLQFFYKKCQNLDFGWTAGNSSSNPSVSGIFRKFPNFLRS